MFKLNQELHVDDIVFYKILEAKLISSRKESVDMLFVKFPKWTGFEERKLKKGMKVKWFAGYSQHELFLEFSGTIVEISKSEPMEIICKDEMYTLQLEQCKKKL